MTEPGAISCALLRTLILTAAAICAAFADVHLAAVNEDERIVTLTGYGTWWAGVVNDLKDEQQPGSARS